MAPEPYSTPPKAFISYSWHDDTHKEWVKQLAIRLRKNGVNVTLDRWHAAPGDQIPAFMERAVRENDFVIAVCTPRFKERSDGRGGGVGYEGDIMTAYAFTGGDERKFIPVLRRGSWREAAPTWLLGRAKIDLSRDPYSESEYEELLQTLHGAREEAPPIGPRPNFGDKKGSQASPAPAPVTPLVESSTPQHQSSVTPVPTHPRPERRPPGRPWLLVASVFGFATLPIVADLVFLAGPPWPARLKTALLTALVACTVLPGAYAWQRSSSPERLRSRTLVFGTLSACLVLAYLALTSAFVYDAPDASHQEAGGFLVKPAVSQEMAQNPSTTLGDLFKGAEYVPDQVWVPWTVAVVRLALVTSWVGVFGLAAAAGACVLRAEWATGQGYGNDSR